MLSLINFLWSIYFICLSSISWFIATILLLYLLIIRLVLLIFLNHVKLLFKNSLFLSSKLSWALNNNLPYELELSLRLTSALYSIISIFLIIINIKTFLELTANKKNIQIDNKIY